MRKHHLKKESQHIDIENRYAYLYEQKAEYSPDKYNKKNMLGGNRQSL